eukprot:TRINITY_DN9451_c0_g1_i1.p1 TRINITY_DN9451_c0_g1~~TRINITY_DN9451_c0_g1_i1.p1  ORF type:complete len:109 (+),score=11.90 TRINITY_DN9451_c0_g1_i1:488-814(+)
MREGSIVGVCLDMDLRAIGFFLDGEYLGVAFTQLPSRVIPCVSLYSPNDEVTLLPPIGSDTRRLPSHVHQIRQTSWITDVTTSRRNKDGWNPNRKRSSFVSKLDLLAS